MTEKLEQQICNKFCLKLEKNGVETIKILKTAFEDECTGNTQMKKWYKWFKDGGTYVDSDSYF